MIRLKHSMRRLPLERKIALLTDIGIDNEQISLIRNLSEPKDKLLRAVELQMEIFGSYSNDLSAWISGFSSESSARKYLGSLKDTNNVNPCSTSQADIKRKVCLPTEMNDFLAEETGIHLGDGCLSLNEPAQEFRYVITGDLTNESNYHQVHIKGLLAKIYGYSGLIYFQQKKNSITTQVKSKGIALFKAKSLGLPIGSKIEAKIPAEILKSESFTRRFITGFIDTDFYLNEGIELKGTSFSVRLMKEISISLERLKVKHNFKIFVVGQKQHASIAISRSGTREIIEQWGLHNDKHITKYEIKQNFNLFVPYTTTTDRLLFLEGKITEQDLIKIGAFRKNLHQ